MPQVNKNKKIKLLIITPSLACGGSEKFVSLLCNHINNNLFRVCLVVVNDVKPFFTISNPEVEVVELRRNRVLFSLPAIKKTVKDFEPDIIFSTANHLNLYLAIFRNQFNKQIRFVAREASIVSINSQQAKMPVLYNWLIKKYYKRFDQVICQSAYMQNDLVEQYGLLRNKTAIIHNAVEDIATGDESAPKSYSERVYKLIAVAGLREEKGIERLIQAAGLITEPFVFYIIGGGEKQMQLQKLIIHLQLQDKIFLTGEKTNPFAGMEDADLFLLGSYYEGFPNALLEAGARGIPAVAFDVPGGIAEIIEDGINGLLVEDNDIIGFAAAIKNGVKTNFNRTEIIEKNKKRFSIHKLVPAVENLFLQLTENK